MDYIRAEKHQSVSQLSCSQVTKKSEFFFVTTAPCQNISHKNHYYSCFVEYTNLSQEVKNSVRVDILKQWI